MKACVAILPFRFVLIDVVVRNVTVKCLVMNSRVIAYRRYFGFDYMRAHEVVSCFLSPDLGHRPIQARLISRMR